MLSDGILFRYIKDLSRTHDTHTDYLEDMVVVTSPAQDLHVGSVRWTRINTFDILWWVTYDLPEQAAPGESTVVAETVEEVIERSTRK